jgi:hypothetical protein
MNTRNQKVLHRVLYNTKKQMIEINKKTHALFCYILVNYSEIYNIKKDDRQKVLAAMEICNKVKRLDLLGKVKINYTEERVPKVIRITDDELYLFCVLESIKE